MKPGDLYWLYDFGPEAEHIHVILTHPEPHPVNGRLRVAVVNLTTIRGTRYDRTTVLTSADHADLGTEARYVRYSDMDFEDVEHIEIDVKLGKAREIQPLAEPLFQRVCDGIFTTPFDPPTELHDNCFERMPGDGEVLKLT